MVLLHAPFSLLERAKMNIEQSSCPYGVANSANSFSVRLLTVWPASQKNQVGAGGESVDVQPRIMCILRGDVIREHKLNHKFTCYAC